MCLRDRLYWGPGSPSPPSQRPPSFPVLLLCLACMSIHTDVSNSKQFMTQKEQNILACPGFQHLFKPKALGFSAQVRRPSQQLERGYKAVETVFQGGVKPKTPSQCQGPLLPRFPDEERKIKSKCTEEPLSHEEMTSRVCVHLPSAAQYFSRQCRICDKTAACVTPSFSRCHLSSCGGLGKFFRIDRLTLGTWVLCTSFQWEQPQRAWEPQEGLT